MAKFNNLPRDIVLEILTRLPTESVLECKPWSDVVRHQSFAQLHLSRLRSADEDSGKLGFIIFSREEKIYPEIGRSRYTHDFYYSEYGDETPFDTKTRIDLNLPFKKCSLGGSCNGLVCFRSWHGTGFGPVYICNPVTREYIILPDIEGFYFGNGFGYCPWTNEYKVVRIHRSNAVEVVQVYTLGSGNGWRIVAYTDIKFDFFGLCAGAFANGALHWADHSRRTILSFHLADEKCSELPYPPCSTQADTRYLAVLGDFLSFTCYGTCEIWLWKKNKGISEWCWSKEFSIESDIAPVPFGFTKIGRLLCFKDYRIFGYNRSSAEMEASVCKPITEAISHKNTLVSLKVLGEKDAKRMESSESASEAMGSLSLEASI